MGPRCSPQDKPLIDAALSSLILKRIVAIARLPSGYIVLPRDMMYLQARGPRQPAVSSDEGIHGAFLEHAVRLHNLPAIPNAIPSAEFLPDKKTHR